MKTVLQKTFFVAFLTLFCLAFSQNVLAQTTYTWNGGATGSWIAQLSWSPPRSAPGANDILVFSSGTTVTPTAVPTQTIGQLSVSGNTIVN